MTSTTQTPPADPIAPALHAVEQMIARRQLTEAAQSLNVLAKQSPGDARLYLLGARIAEAAGNAVGAVDACRRAVAAAPAWSVAVTELAMALARANQFQDAIEQAQKAVQLDPGNLPLLARCIDVAHRSQHFPLAIQWLRAALALAPGNLEMQRLVARDLRLTKQHTEALAAYDQLLAAHPGDAPALLGRSQTAQALGDNDAARRDADAVLALQPDKPEYRFWNDVVHGRTPSRQPAAMIESLYDEFAPVYDQHVVRTLKYQLPKAMAERMLQWHPDRNFNLLDLGCGTGLLGVCLGKLQGAMVGVDLSRPMIEQAVRHNLYDRFHNVDLLDALEATPGDQYEVIAALDVFIYAGELARAIPDAFRILKPGGRLVLSCEHAGDDEPDMVLRPSLRFAHRPSAVEALCQSAGFEDVTIEPVALREEDHQPVEGFVVVARKPA
jgi:predicted TPR repeat methyltransferase